MPATQDGREHHASSWQPTALLERLASFEAATCPRLTAAARLFLLCFLLLAFRWSWATWPDLIVDCGREMYVPAELALGKRLYRDVFYNYMPLPPQLHAMLFRLFGIHLSVLYWAGFVVTTASVFLLHAIALRFLPPIAALTVALSYAVRLFSPSIFNNILPYSFGATYGHLGCLAALYFLLLHRSTGRRRYYHLAAAAATLALLAKHEYGMAAYGSLALLALADAWVRRSWQCLVRAMGAMLPGLCLAVAWTAWFIYPDTFRHFVETNWIAFPGGHFMRVYGPMWIEQQGLGSSPAEMVILAVLACLPIAFWAGFTLLAKKVRGWKSGSAVAVGLLLLAALLVLARSASAGVLVLTRLPLIPSQPFYYALLLAAWGGSAYLLPGRFRIPAWVAAFFPVAVFGSALGIRVMNDWHLVRYTIFFTPIATLAFAMLLVQAVVSLLRETPRPVGSAVLVLICSLQVGAVAWFVRTEIPAQSRPDTLISTARGDIYVPAAHAGFARGVLQRLDEVRRRNGTALFLPEATALYFLGGVSSPSRYYFFHPGVLAPGAVTQAFLAEMELAPPSTIFLTNRNTSEYGAPYFGLDYDREVLDWVKARYQPVAEVGRFARVPGAPVAARVFERVDPDSPPAAQQGGSRTGQGKGRLPFRR